ncbi:MAG: GDYXXLXY domain-containing protein [Candidatus Omnitrophota bacterium]|jgi:uncharacterized membrane-anchored protein
MNKKIILLLVILLWIILALAMIIPNQSILSRGRAVVLETVPVDPRDLLRGDYVVLRYKISSLDLSRIKSEKADYRRGEVIYVRLEPKGRFWEAAAVQSKKTADNVTYIKGRVRQSYNKQLRVVYGIESYFVPEGEGKELERSMLGSKSSVNVEVMVDSSGNALIKKVHLDKR